MEVLVMATCKKCGGKLSFLGACEHCRKEALQKSSLSADGSQAEQLDENDASQRMMAEVQSVLLTTETAPNLNITKRIEIVTAEVAYGMNIFKDLFAGVRDIVGGRSEAVQKTMRDARRTALYELKREAHSVGANAVVGVDLDYVELQGATNMVMLVASGTAVVIED
jgi:uncharacterized protein YbjQ (UPF0145 family)